MKIMSAVELTIHTFLESRNGASIKVLEKTFPTINDIRQLLQSAPSLFWISKVSENDWNVKAKVDIKLCYLYLNSTCLGNCGCLHICKDYLLSQLSCNSVFCKYGFSHNFQDEHNRSVLSNCNIQSIGTLRSSFPRICKSFGESGTCNKLFCGYLHICSEFIRGSCASACVLAEKSKLAKANLHNYGNEHNKMVLAVFNLSFQKNDRQNLITNILMEKTETGAASSVISSESNSNLSIASVPPVLSDKMPEKLNVMICTYYLNGNCKNTLCSRLHFCKEFLIDGSKCSAEKCKFGFSHDPFNHNNKEIMRKNDVLHLTKVELTKLLRNSFPRVCKDYQNGQVCYKYKCPRIHICQDYACGICELNDCVKSHDLKDTHNIHILEAFCLTRLRGNKVMKEEDFILSNILYSKNIETVSAKVSQNTTGHSSSFPAATNVHWKKLNKDWETGANGNSNVKEQIDHTVNKGKQQIDHTVSKGFVSNSTTTKRTEPTEEEIVNFFVAANQDGTFPLSDESLLNHFHHDMIFAEKWFQKHKYVFRLVKDMRGCNMVHICVEEIRPCSYYWRRAGCSNKFCRNFHVCRQFLFNASHNKRRCNIDHSHNLDDEHNKKLMLNLPFSSLTQDSVLLLLKKRYPSVCMDYNNQCCTYREDLCPDLHICCDFMKGSCKKIESICNFKHESAFSGVQAKQIMQNYHLNEKELRPCLIISKYESNKGSIKVMPVVKIRVNHCDGGIVEHGLGLCSNVVVLKNYSTEMIALLSTIGFLKIIVNFDPWKEEAICHHYLAGECDDRLCRLLHPTGKVPYLWQFQKKGEDTWSSFPTDVTLKMEKEYCDPSSNVWNSIDGLFCESFSLLDQNNFNCYKETAVKIRRLSTKSSVMGSADDIALTQWKWYWSQGKSEWTEYATWATSEKIEVAYLNNIPDFHFETDEFKYKISFDNMIQMNQNPKYGTVRDIRRRPVFRTKISNLRKNQSMSISTLPNHWPRNHQPGERITINKAEFIRLKKEFENSMSRQVLVLDIKEVCNTEHFDRFERKKHVFQERLTNINEIYLYHGTEHSVVDSICVQNFDWRLCGKNATRYGQGSYFSKSAEYSHNYTTPTISSTRYMFVASILAGRSAMGDSSMKRPPTLHASSLELYESCVDRLYNPSIYVIFERDQCYPRYLITYKELQYVTENDKRLAQASLTAANSVSYSTYSNAVTNHASSNISQPKYSTTASTTTPQVQSNWNSRLQQIAVASYTSVHPQSVRRNSPPVKKNSSCTIS